MPGPPPPPDPARSSPAADTPSTGAAGAGRRTLGPRLVVAGTHSGVGKTTVATGLMAALAGRGLRVAPAKVGPDFIDPGYHALATGRPGRNLDAWMCGPDAVGPLAGRAAAGADILVVEGVMGLFDGAADGTPSSSADVAVLLDAPVVLVVDASGMAASIGALVRGFRDHRPDLRLGGVIVNRVGGPGHERLLAEALEPLGVPLLGALRPDDRFAWRDRHLGLVPVAEHPETVRAGVEALADAVAGGCDLDALVALARSAPARAVDDPPLPAPVAGPPVRIAVAGGPAFTFAYPDNAEALVAAGAELVPFDPLTEPALPDAVDGLVVGGGFPEVFAERLAANTPLAADVRRRVGAGLPTWAECGGLLWLSEALDGHAMAGVLPTRTRLTERLTLGYRTAELAADSPLGSAGTRLRGHEFHYSVAEPPGDAVVLRGRARGGAAPERRDGFASPTLLASYLHVHLGAEPAPARRFVETCARHAGPPPRPPASTGGGPT